MDSPSSFFERHAPREFPNPCGDSVTENKILLEPFNYIIKHQGKNMRSKLVMAFDHWLQIDEKKRTEVSAVIEKLHNASLLIDDIEDNSTLRRGAPVAHNVFGVPMTINCANFVYFEAFQDALALGKPDIVGPFIDEVLLLHRGQGLDIYYRDNAICPSEEQYVSMVKDKTGGLLRLAVSLMQAFSENRTDYMPLVNDLGLFFQVMDDLLNLKSDKYHHNKSFCEDLTEGKFSFPIVHHVRSNPGDNRVLNILRKRTSDVEMKMFAVRCLQETGSFDYTITYLRCVYERICVSIDGFGGNELLQRLIDGWWEMANNAWPCEATKTDAS